MSSSASSGGMRKVNTQAWVEGQGVSARRTPWLAGAHAGGVERPLPLPPSVPMHASLARPPRIVCPGLSDQPPSPHARPPARESSHRLQTTTTTTTFLPPHQSRYPTSLHPNMVFRAALTRAAAPLVRVRPTLAASPAPLRLLSSSAVRRADDHGHPPIIQGEGGKPGETPTDLQQATGIERLELLGRLEGIEIFDMKPLDASRIGTMKNPIAVKSLVSATASEEEEMGTEETEARKHTDEMREKQQDLKMKMYLLWRAARWQRYETDGQAWTS